MSERQACGLMRCEQHLYVSVNNNNTSNWAVHFQVVALCSLVGGCYVSGQHITSTFNADM